MHGYVISGVSVCSELALPGAIPAPAVSCPDVTIRRALVPLDLDNPSASGPTWAARHGAFLLRVPRVARFLLTAGREIAFEAEPEATDRDTAAFALGSAFGILMHQRGALVLHGAAVVRRNRAFAICGPSGAGKSTLAAALCSAGCSHLTDDICVVGLDAAGSPVVFPDGRRLKLWKDAIDHFDLADRRGEPVRESFEKYFLEPSDPQPMPVGLSAIFVIRDEHVPLKAGIEALPLPDAMRAFERTAFRPQVRSSIGHPLDLFSQTAAILRSAKVFRLTRPRGFEHMEATVEALFQHLDSLD